MLLRKLTRIIGGGGTGICRIAFNRREERVAGHHAGDWSVVIT